MLDTIPIAIRHTKIICFFDLSSIQFRRTMAQAKKDEKRRHLEIIKDSTFGCRTMIG